MTRNGIIVTAILDCPASTTGRNTCCSINFLVCDIWLQQREEISKGGPLGTTSHHKHVPPLPSPKPDPVLWRVTVDLCSCSSL